MIRDVFSTAHAWSLTGRPFAFATLVDAVDAAPSPVGATMAVATDGTIVGDIGAGCHEGDIVESAIASAGDRRPRTLRIDLTGGDPITGGSGCGGSLEIVTWTLDARSGDASAAVRRGASDATVSFGYERNGDARRFELLIPARSTLLVVGATALASELATLGARLDFRTVVVDPRPAFATAARLRGVHAIEVAWPDEALPRLLRESTPLIVASHDPKLDVPALRAGLESDAAYIGLLGSRRAQLGRRDTLREAGFGEAALARIRGPAGLDIGGAGPAETALSILAEVVANRSGRRGAPLTSHTGRIHST